MGILSKAEAEDADTRHVLSRSLGSNLFVKIDVTELEVQPGDVLLLCSDGLHGAVSSEEIARIVSRKSDLNAAAQDLVASANQKDGGDNVSVQLVRVRGVERIGMYRGRPYKLR
jgi:protein phosphatase